jgi:hypothetical protein
MEKSVDSAHKGYGLRRPGPPWTGGHCRVFELIRAQPPAAPVAGVAERGVEVGKGSTGVLVPGSPGLRRRQSDGASVVKVAAGRALVWVARGLKMGQGGAGEERWEEGMLKRPFIWSEGIGAAGRRRGMSSDSGAP